jgi:hypothetical protein
VLVRQARMGVVADMVHVPSERKVANQIKNDFSTWPRIGTERGKVNP